MAGRTLDIHGEDLAAQHALLDVLFQYAPRRVVLVVLDPVLDGVRDERRTLDIVSLLGHGDVDLVGNRLDPRAAHLLLHPVGQQQVARRVAHVHHALFRVCRGLDDGDGGVRRDRLDVLAVLGRQVGEPNNVDLVDDEHDGLVCKQGLDRVEELALGLDRIAALLRQVHKVHDGAPEVGEGRDGLHLDRVHLFERVVEHAGRVDDLPPEVLVVHVPDKERLGRERVRLHVDIGPRDLVDERALADVGVAADQQRPRVGVDRGQTRNVLPDLFEVGQGILLALHDGRHPAQGGALQLLAPVQRVAKLEQAAVVFGDLRHEVARSVELAEGELVVVLVV